VSLTFGKIAAIAGALVVGIWMGYGYRDTSESPLPVPEHADDPHRNVRSSGRVVRSLAHGLGGKLLDDRALEQIETLERLALLDPRQALAQLDSFSEPNMRSLALAAIGRGWGDRDPKAASVWVEGLESPEDQVQAALGLMPVWAEREPENAMAWSLARAEGSAVRELSVLEVADAWGGIFPRQAMDAFLALPGEAGVERGLHAISTQWALDAPEQAIGYFSSLDPAGRRDEFLEAALVSLTNKNPEMTWREAHRVGDAGRVAHVQSQALEAIAESRPQEALRLAETDGDKRLNYLGIGRGWAYLNREEAQAWAGSLEDVELGKAVLAEIRKSVGNAPTSE
jgi:hypothetical protein